MRCDKMKKRIFINIHYMEIGGAESALLGLLSALDPDKVDVDLFINQHTGELLPLIPKYVNVLPEDPVYSSIERPLKQILMEGHVGIACRRLVAKFKHRKYRKSLTKEQAGIDASIFQYVADEVDSALPSLAYLGTYDLGISFANPHNIVLNKVKAKKKLCWIHTDYSTVSIDTEREVPVWGAYDKIVSISDDVTRSFLSRFPSLASKIIRIDNILSCDFVLKRACEFDASGEFDGKINLLSIGRYCAAKNYDNVPAICKILREAGLDVKWYIIGYGGEEALIRQCIAESGMEECVILLGKKSNPYPYIKACDIYVQPSRYEGKSITVREAQILCKPVVVTRYPTAASQISDGTDGVIVPLDNEGCARGIADFVADEELRQKIVDNLRAGDHANESEVEKIYELLK